MQIKKQRIKYCAVLPNNIRAPSFSYEFIINIKKGEEDE